MGPSERRHSCELVGVEQESADPVADQADRGLEARDQQPDGLDEQLVGPESISFLLGPDQRREEVVAEVPAALVDECAEVVGQGSRSRAGLGERPGL
jgi:hypothetical protein